MKWLDLDLGRAAEVDRQVDEVIATYNTLQSNRKSASGAQVQKALQLLRKSVVERVNGMEAFYHQNDLDPRANRIETARLKLKRLMKEAGFDATTVKNESGSSSSRPRGQSRAQGTPASASQSPGSLPPEVHAPAAAKMIPSAPLREGFEEDTADKVTLQIEMTHEQYEELKRRREAMQQLVKRGQGKLAWEGAYNSPRGDARKEGMYTGAYDPMHKGSMRSPRESTAAGKYGRFDTTGSVRNASPGRLADGQPYQTANSTLVSQKMRFNSPRVASTGGSRSVGNKSFNAVTPRTRATSTMKMFPLGSMR